MNTLPNLLHGRARFLTASSAPAHWKVLTSASPLQLRSFVFHHHHLKHASSQHLRRLRVSFHHCFVEQKHKKAPKLTAPWYISTSLSPKYGICLKGLTEMSTGPMYVWWVLILKNIMWRKAPPIFTLKVQIGRFATSRGENRRYKNWYLALILLLPLAVEKHYWFLPPRPSPQICCCRYI